MRSTAIIFRGADQVIEAYEAMDIPAWSLWAGKDQLLFSYPQKRNEEANIIDGCGDLRQALEMLKRGGTSAQLVLKVYESLPDGKIKSNTPFDNSFGFSLFALDEESPAVVSRTVGYKNLEDRIDKLTALVLANQEEPDEKPGGVMGMIGTLFEEPGMKQFVVGEVVNLVRNIFTKNNQPPATMAGTDAPGQAQGSKWEGLQAEQQEKIKQAMELLMGADPLIGDHLLGLARIAVNDPQKYLMALKFL